MKILILSLISFISFRVHAQTSCSIEGAVRCMCSHSMTVTCDNGQKGFIGNDEKITSVTVRVTDDAGISRLIKLNNPPGGAREYYAADSNDWVRSELKNRGIAYREASAVSFTTPKEPSLFSDSGGRNPLSASAYSTVKDGLDCTAASEPMVIKGTGPTCNTQKVCYMRVKCAEYFAGKFIRNHGETDAVCKASGDGACPSATNCANDPDVAMEKATFARASGSSGSSNTGRGTR